MSTVIFTASFPNGRQVAFNAIHVQAIWECKGGHTSVMVGGETFEVQEPFRGVDIALCNAMSNAFGNTQCKISERY